MGEARLAADEGAGSWRKMKLAPRILPSIPTAAVAWLHQDALPSPEPQGHLPSPRANTHPPPRQAQHYCVCCASNRGN